MNYDVVRGVLMVIVMLDHNDIVRSVRSVNQWFLPMTFHVTGFLLLPFIVRPKLLSLAMVRDHAVRYLTPFLFALLGYAVAFHVLVATGLPAWKIAGDIAAAFVFADPAHLQAATGFIVLWFLPALLSVVLLLSVYDAISSSGRTAILAGTLAVHLAVGGAPAYLKSHVPQGWLIALYIFPLGIAVRHLMPWLMKSWQAPWIAMGSVMVLMACWAFEQGREVEVATLVLPTIGQPLWIVATDLSDISFFIVLLICSRPLAAVSGLAVIGRYSLLIYLFHPILYKPIFDVLLRFCTPEKLAGPNGFVVYIIGASVSFISVACLSLLAAVAIQAWPPTRKLITPRGAWRNIPARI